MTAHEPFGKQLQLASQQCHVVAGQWCVHRQLLESQQSGDSLIEQMIGILCVDHIQISFISQVVQQQETTLKVLGMDDRDIDPGGRQQSGDVHERLAVFLGRRCIHDNEAAALAFPAKIPSKARIAAGGGQSGRRDVPPPLGKEEICQLFVEPYFQVLQAYIVFRHYKGLRRR
ncbi:hypothetical protein D9M73_144010 [compost metagenome]